MKEAVYLTEMIMNGETGKARAYAENMCKTITPPEFARGYAATAIHECARMINYKDPCITINGQKLRRALCDGDFPNICGAIKYISECCTRKHKEDCAARIEKAARFIDLNFKNSQVSISDAARYAGFKNAELSVLFKEHYGVLPKDYITNKRLDFANELAENSNIAIKDIAVKAGFSDSSQFIRAYKKHYGITPLQKRYYKQEYKE